MTVSSARAGLTAICLCMVLYCLVDEMECARRILEARRSSDTTFSTSPWKVSSSSALWTREVASSNPSSNECDVVDGFPTGVMVLRATAAQQTSRNIHSVLLTTVTSFSRSHRLDSTIQMLIRGKVKGNVREEGRSGGKEIFWLKKKTIAGKILDRESNLSESAWEKRGVSCSLGK